jgi:ATP-binding protein involved in chromosome partitioning
MFERVGVRVLGVVENMSYFESPETGKPLAIFGSGGGKRLADELNIPLLGEIPLYTPVREGGDEGHPIVVADPASSASRKLVALSARVAEMFGR